jgi:hypothetical protein
MFKECKGQFSLPQTTDGLLTSIRVESANERSVLILVVAFTSMYLIFNAFRYSRSRYNRWTAENFKELPLYLEYHFLQSFQLPVGWQEPMP